MTCDISAPPGTALIIQSLDHSESEEDLGQQVSWSLLDHRGNHLYQLHQKHPYWGMSLSWDRGFITQSTRLPEPAEFKAERGSRGRDHCSYRKSGLPLVDENWKQRTEKRLENVGVGNIHSQFPVSSPRRRTLVSTTCLVPHCPLFLPMRGKLLDVSVEDTWTIRCGLFLPVSLELSWGHRGGL